MTYSTNEVAKKVGMTVSQIHYYDRLGLIPNLNRSTNGYRDFSETNLVWLTKLKLFTDSGMSLKDIQQLTQLVGEGKLETVKKRREIVEGHIFRLVQQESEIHDQITYLHQFLDEYDHLEGMS